MKHIIVCIALVFGLLTSIVNAAQESTGGVDHIGLSVSDLTASTNFFVDVLGFKKFGQDAKYPAVFLTNQKMRLTLWQTSDDAVQFNRKKNVGLHHLAIRVTSFDALDDLHATMQKMPNIIIEFAPELSYGGPAKHMMIREPSGNRIELIHRPDQ